MADPNYTLRQYGIGAGFLYIGTTPWGPSIGGYEFAEGKQYRILEADGLTTEKVGMRRITGWDVHIRGRLKDLSSEVLLAMQPGSTSDGSSGNNAVVQPDARVIFAEGDYLQDVRLIYKRVDPDTGQTNFAAFVFGLGIVENFTQAGEDSNEQIRNLDIKAVLPSAHSPNDCPYVELIDYDHDTFDINDYFTLTP